MPTIRKNDAHGRRQAVRRRDQGGRRLRRRPSLSGRTRKKAAVRLPFCFPQLHTDDAPGMNFNEQYGHNPPEGPAMKTSSNSEQSTDRPLAVVSPRFRFALTVMAQHDVGPSSSSTGTTGRHLFRSVLCPQDHPPRQEFQRNPGQEIMSDKVAYVTPAHSIDQCMALMTESASATCPSSTGTAVAGLGPSATW